MICFRLVTRAGKPIPDQSWVSRPNGSEVPTACATGPPPGVLAWPCVELRAHQHQSMSAWVSQAMMLPHQGCGPWVPGAGGAQTRPNSPIQSGAMLPVRMNPPFWFMPAM